MTKDIIVVSAVLVTILGMVSSLRADGELPPFSPEKASFSVRFKAEVSPYRVLAVFVLPEEKSTVEVDSPRQRNYEVFASGGSLQAQNPRKWKWQAPATPGLYPLTIREKDSGETITLNAFVMVPRDRMEKGILNGYLIGKYPQVALRGLSIYRPPSGFVEVTPHNRETRVSPHFTLGQFLCKQESDYPKYVILRVRLLLKLELILEHVNSAGVRCDSFHVMSGYRTPFYNALLGDVKYSRHQWGGAADIFIDENPRDGMMDDLNNDGKIDERDATVLYQIIDDLYGRPWYTGLAGGLGQYAATAAHGPFVHIDARGFRARWGE